MTGSTEDLRIIHAAVHVDEMSETAFPAHVIDKLGNLHESVENIAPAATEEAMERAFSSALNNFIESDRTWEKCGEKVSKLAQKQAGAFILDGLKTMAKRVFWLGIGALFIWHYFGWSGLVSFFKAGHTQ